MGTVLELDVNRKELTELPFSLYRRCSDLTLTQGGANLVTRWGTGSITLKPVQLTTAFSETNLYEDLKFRLYPTRVDPGSIIFNADNWDEVPENTLPDVGPCDYFYVMKVPKDQAPSTINQRVGFNLIDRFDQVVLNAISTVEEHGWNAIRSSGVYPPNQGYCLRFRVDGRSTYSRGRILEFRFGNFSLALNSDGVAELWQTLDWQTYGFVHSFHWADSGMVHGQYHSLIVFPHARDCLEVCSFLEAKRFALATVFNKVATVGRKDVDFHRGMYRLPGGPYLDGDGNPVITEEGPWSLRLSREFRHKLQVSLLMFRSGLDESAGLIDSPIPLEFPPFNTVNVQPDGDNNGCSYYYGLKDSVSGELFASDGTMQTPQFFIGFQGLGDFCDQMVSSATPELYGYNVDKPPLFSTVTRNTVVTPVMSVSIDNGDAPENERLTVHADNSLRQLDNFRYRADVPLILGDLETNNVFFEGTSFQVRGSDAPGNSPRAVEWECHGMADQLVRARWWNPPNFGRDPYDTLGRAWYWQQAVARCFAAAGFDPDTQVWFENPYDDQSGQIIDFHRYNFRLWLDGDAGGTGEGAEKAGGSNKDHTPGGRWWPIPNTPVYQFLDYLLRQVLGWGWYWDRYNHRWVIYKRPSAAALAATTPKAVFAGSRANAFLAESQFPGVPVYLHRNMAWELTRPEYTTLICYAMLDVAQVQSKEELRMKLPDLTAKFVGGSPSPDSEVATVKRWVGVPFDNPNGYASAAHPNPDQYGPDYLGRMRARAVPLKTAGSREAVQWIGRRFYEDLCFGRVWRNWNAIWGDSYTSYLRKWDVIALDTGDNPLNPFEQYTLDRVEPEWSGGGTDNNRRARYRASKYRSDAAPPR